MKAEKLQPGDEFVIGEGGVHYLQTSPLDAITPIEVPEGFVLGIARGGEQKVIPNETEVKVITQSMDE